MSIELIEAAIGGARVQRQVTELELRCEDLRADNERLRGCLRELIAKVSELRGQLARKPVVSAKTIRIARKGAA